MEILGEYSKEQFTQRLSVTVKRLVKDKTPVAQPTAFLLGGQPGSQMTILQGLINEKMNGNVIIINNDELKPLHPHYKTLVQKHGMEATKLITPFSNRMAEELIAQLSKKHYNLVIEGTWQTFEMLQTTVKLLQERGFKTNLYVIAVSKQLSYINILTKYEDMFKNDPLTAQKIPKQIHDEIVHNLPLNIDELFTFVQIHLFTRTKEQIYSSLSATESPKFLLESKLHETVEPKVLDEYVKRLFAKMRENGHLTDSVKKSILLHLNEYETKAKLEGEDDASEIVENEDTTSYKNFKQNQIDQYKKRSEQYKITAKIYLFISVCLWACATGLGAFVIFGNPPADVILINLITIASLFLCGRIFWLLRRYALKSSVLLEQLASELLKVLRSNSNLEKIKAEILSVETKFLANDDELYTKKFIWQPFLDYMEAKHTEGKEAEKPIINIPAVWMSENPFDINDDDGDFVNLNWEIKREFRYLYLKNYGSQRAILENLSKEACQSDIVFERFLRSKKVSKKLKKFKAVTRVFYLSAAAKMRLISFVDSVLSERPYAPHCTEMIALRNKKNLQIQKATNDFWKLHRRSLKFYVFELVLLALVVPLVMISTTIFDTVGFIPAALVFFAGAMIIVYGAMALVLRQLRDLKSKKLVPGLIAFLIAIRHSMCSTVVLDKDVVKKYEEYFKKAEKRFILTVTEAEAVDYATENVVEKVEENLADIDHLQDQVQKYYEKFHYYRRQCLKYVVLEAFVALMVIPVYAFVYRLSVERGWGVFESLHWIVLGVAAFVQIILIIRHVRVARRRELFLLIYQKLAAVLGDYSASSEEDELVEEFEELEESIIKAADSDNMPDVSEYIQECSNV